MKGCRALTEAEVPRVIAAITGRYALRDKALMVLGLKTGLRISELLSLRLNGVWQDGRLLDRVHVERRHTKRRMEGKALPIHAMAKAALAEWILSLGPESCTSNPTQPLFPGFRGSSTPMSRVGAWRVFGRAFAGADLRGPGLGCHVTRKTFAARIWEAVDHDIIKTQAALAHKSVSSTVAYLSFNDNEVEAAILAA